MTTHRSRPMSSRRRPQRRNAFTLVEVMISMAIVLVLIIGVNQVFKITAETVGTGQALSAKIRDARAVQSVFQNEMLHIPPNQSAGRAPFLYIDSRTQAAFRSVRDRENDRDFNPAGTPAQQRQQMLTIDFDGDNIEGTAPGERHNLATMSDRVHRVDTFSFFARDLYRRQTGNVNSGQSVYISDMSSGEAWVTYQHLRVFNQATPDTALDVDANYIGPGLGTALTNPRNYYASDWVLGRMAMLLAKPEDTNSPKDGYGDRILDRPFSPPPPTPQRFWMRKPGDNENRLTPFGKTTQLDNTTALTIPDARYDLIGTDMQEFSGLLRDYIEHTEYYIGGSQQTPNYPEDSWWRLLPIDPTAATGRWRANPYPRRPLNPRKLAQTAPAMLNNCTQFAVEFAGDFLTQGPPGTATYGEITAVGPDGVIDFYLEAAGAGIPMHRIRWYGFPRDVNGDGVINGFHTGIAASGDAHNALLDVVPLRDIILTWDKNWYNGMDQGANRTTKWPLVRFERDVYPPSGPFVNELPWKQNYADPAAGVGPDDYYTCVWGPDDLNRPKLIRLIFAVDDPNGRLSAGQRYEYVFNMP